MKFLCGDSIIAQVRGNVKKKTLDNPTFKTYNKKKQTVEKDE